MAPLSPMMQQYFELKERHKDHILFFRLGDFYEMFFDDARLASQELDLTLTGRECGQEERAPMCGVPYHSCEAYIARLVKKGYKVAICEQIDDPKTTRGMLRREVVRVITPGTLIEDAMLEEGSNNFIASVFVGDGMFGLAFADISTGEVHLSQVPEEDETALQNELARFSPSEVIFNSDFLSKNKMGAFLKDRLRCCADMIGDEVFEQSNIQRLLEKQFGHTALEGLALLSKRPIAFALGGLVSYLEDTQKTGVERLVSLDLYSDKRFMNLDINARRNLELTRTMRTGEKRGSLLWVIDRTRTAMGKRLLRLYLEQPLVNPVVIEKRLNAVEELLGDSMLRMDLTGFLGGIRDMERLLTRIVCRSTTPREVKSLEATLRMLPAVRERLGSVAAAYLCEVRRGIDPMEDLAGEIGRVIDDDPPALMKDGGYIKKGCDDELDRLRELLTNTKGVLAKIEADERERTGIKSLKIGYNKVFGYYIEISNSYLSQVPAGYIRKQTLTNGERFITEELKNLEEQILTAREKSLAIEARRFEELRSRISENVRRIQDTAAAIARLDVFCCFAEIAAENNYCRPELSTGGEIVIRDGRHPVVEVLLGSAGRFVANDAELDLRDNQIAILTGPNMAGKSTYMRQVALIVLLAQIGSFVPAASAKIGLVDGIYTRVGASDDLATGQSTFMVEMSEVADILKNATRNSLLILDEVGRGTSTFDGMSIARAMLEYIADPKKLGAKTLFATHYHELTELESIYPMIKNYNTAVKKRGDDITFLRKILPGAVDDSYGIEVSKLAGIPDWIIRRAHQILDDLEASRPVEERRKAVTFRAAPAPEQILMVGERSKVEEELEKVDVNVLTPLEALNKLYELKALLNAQAAKV